MQVDDELSWSNHIPVNRDTHLAMPQPATEAVTLSLTDSMSSAMPGRIKGPYGGAGADSPEQEGSKLQGDKPGAAPEAPDKALHVGCLLYTSPSPRD